MRTSHRFFRIAFASFLLACAGAGAAMTAAVKAKGQGPAPARKVLVVAKIREEAKRRALEEEARIELQKKGVETILGSDVMTEADFASEDTIRKKVESLGVDGVLGFVVLGIDEKQKTSSATLSVGVGGYGGGGFGMFVGGSVPIGGTTTIVRTVHLRSRFWARPFEAPAWEKLYDEKLEADTTRLTQYLAYDSVKTLKKKKLVPAK
jgi:opacity protein-like surface antigen